MNETDPYLVLGVSRNASDEEIKTAYRRLAQRYHPDLHPEDKDAVRKMTEINTAYDQIKNPQAWRNIPNAQQAQQTWEQASHADQGYGGRQQYARPDRDASILYSARVLNQSGQYAESVGVLERVDPARRTGEWYYLAAFANSRMNNQVTALRYARMATEQDPDNREYQELLSQLSSGDHSYRSASRAPVFSGLGRLVAGVCACNLLSRICCRC